jgi:hypothetical protein
MDPGTPYLGRVSSPFAIVGLTSTGEQALLIKCNMTMIKQYVPRFRWEDNLLHSGLRITNERS